MVRPTVHASMQRLLKAAQEATEHLQSTRQVTDLGDVLRWLNDKPEQEGKDNVSAGTFTNWKGERGMSRQGALLAEKVIGCSAGWLLTGKGKRWVIEPAASKSGVTWLATGEGKAPAYADPWPFGDLLTREEWESLGPTIQGAAAGAALEKVRALQALKPRAFNPGSLPGRGEAPSRQPQQTDSDA